MAYSFSYELHVDYTQEECGVKVQLMTKLLEQRGNLQ